ncbi:MAG: 1-deoxy-D-xylulose-5-phosphate reductoisomerase, partial [Actinomycetota bacterium]|nr:1-deoxy-D-xylulose-5-phosphate reductoisomerase [Actinomycetota bacterium]
MTTVAVLGATGSIGSQTVEVVRAEPDRFDVTALAAWSSVDQLIAQAQELRPDAVAIGEPDLFDRLKAEVTPNTEVLVGAAG